MKKILLIFMICFALVLTPVFFSGCNEPDFKGEIILPSPPQKEDDGTETPSVNEDPSAPNDETKPETPTDGENVDPPAQETSPFSAEEKELLTSIVQNAIAQVQNLTVESFKTFFMEEDMKVVIKFSAPLTLDITAMLINPSIRSSLPKDIDFHSNAQNSMLYITFSKTK